MSETYGDDAIHKVKKAGHYSIGGSATGEIHSSFRILYSAFPRGFTMIELLLVIVIIAISLGIAAPALVRSIHGARLKSAARTMVTVARYARSMAVLKQTDLTLSFNLANGQVDLTSTNVGIPRFTRMIDDVRLESVQIEGKDPVSDGTCAVDFKRNGVCRPFNIKVTDSRGNYVIVKVDALAGVRATEYGH